MKRFLIPLVLLLLGVGGGVGAGLVLSPADEATPAAAEAEQDGAASAEAGHDVESAEEAPSADHPPAEPEHEEPPQDEAAGHDYVRFHNQFVVPLLTDGEVVSLVLLSIAVEVSAGGEEQALSIEPKLRDAFLQVLFNHANAGGFDGLFTAGSAMRELRRSLLTAAQEEAGPLITDVLIMDLGRQDQ